MCNAKFQVLLCSVITLEIASLASINEKRYTMPVVLLKWYTIPPSVQGARTTLKENNSSVAKQ